MSSTTGIDPTAGRTPDDVEGVLHEEIGRLPEKYRRPVVLCYLEGLTHDQAADRLGWPVGTVRRRLAGARDRLRGRLTRRGVAPVFVSTWESVRPAVPVPSRLAAITVRGALRVGMGKAALAGIVSAEAMTLMKGGTQAMATNGLIATTTAVLTAGLFITGLGLQTDQGRPAAIRTALAQASGASELDADRERGKPARAQQPGADRRDFDDQLGAILREFDRMIGPIGRPLSRDDKRISLYGVYYDDPPLIPRGANAGIRRMPVSRRTGPLPGICIAGIPLREYKGVLLVAVSSDRARRPGPPDIYRDVVIIPRLPQGIQALQIRPGGAKLLELRLERVPGGTPLHLPEFDRTTMILCTTDSALCDRIRVALGHAK